MKFRLIEERKYLDKERDISDYGTGRAEGTDIFADRVGVSYYDQLFTDPEYMKNKKNMVGEVVRMTPRQYFDECAKVFTGHGDHAVSPQDLERQRGYDKRILSDLTDIVTKYKTKLFMPYINYAEGEQEGLHRMLVAANLFGWDKEKFPVLIIRWADEDLHKRQEEEKYQAHVYSELSTAVDEALRFSYPKDYDKFIEYFKEQIDWELDRAARWITDEDLEKAKSSIDVSLDDDRIVVEILGMEIERDADKIDYTEEEDNEEDADDDYDIDDIDLDDLGSFFFDRK